MRNGLRIMHQRLTGLNPLPTHATIYQRVEVKSLLATASELPPTLFPSERKHLLPPAQDRVSFLPAASRSANTIIPYTQDWGNADAISPHNLFLANPTPVSTVARMPTSSRRSRRGEVDSSDDDESNARTRATRRRPGKPFIPPVTKNMPGGSDPYITTPGGTRRPHTYEEVTAMIMVAFKLKIDPKQFLPFKDEARWIQWWNHFHDYS